MTPTVTDPWVVLHRPNPRAKLRLFCFPYAGSGAAVFRTWPAGLPETLEVCAIQYPGRENRLDEPACCDLKALVASLAAALPPYLDRPFAFFGHSMGALVGFELARALRRSGPGPVHLFASAAGAPQTPELQPLNALSDDSFLKRLCALNGIPKEVLQNEELMQLMLPVLRADFTLYETYFYRNAAPLACPISVFGGLQDGKVGCDRLEAWRGQTSERFCLQMFPGDHFFLRSAQPLLLESIAEALQPHLG